MKLPHHQVKVVRHEAVGDDLDKRFLSNTGLYGSPGFGGYIRQPRISSIIDVERKCQQESFVIRRYEEDFLLCHAPVIEVVDPTDFIVRLHPITHSMSIPYHLTLYT